MEGVSEITLDDDLNFDTESRLIFDWLKKWRKVTVLAIILVCSYNIFGPVVFIVSKLQSWPIVGSFGLGLGLCLVLSIIGTFVGVILAFLPLKDLPYLLKLPLATLSGILLVSFVYAVVSTYLVLTLVGESSAPLF
ncbi:MAG: hypothetical protein AB8F78_08440 [Saprospiraceae bacterium]